MGKHVMDVASQAHRAGWDRRAAYTRRAIHSAFYELLEATPFAKISVADICRCADVNRATFYRHYEDKYQLVDELIDEALACVVCDEEQRGLDVCQQLPTNHYHLLLYRDLEIGARMIARIVERYGGERVEAIQKRTNLDADAARLLQIYTAYGNFAVNRLLKWERGDAWRDAQRVIKRFVDAGYVALEEVDE